MHVLLPGFISCPAHSLSVNRTVSCFLKNVSFKQDNLTLNLKSVLPQCSGWFWQLMWCSLHELSWCNSVHTFKERKNIQYLKMGKWRYFIIATAEPIFFFTVSWPELVCHYSHHWIIINCLIVPSFHWCTTGFHWFLLYNLIFCLV